MTKGSYLWARGYLENNRGWWHPPSCVAAWPIDEAYKMARRDSRHMSATELMDYHREVGIRVTEEYREFYKSQVAEANEHDKNTEAANAT